MYAFIKESDVVTGSAQYDLVSLEALKQALEITGTEEDEELQRQITAISQAIAEYLGYPLALSDIIEVFVFLPFEWLQPDRAIVLKAYPVEAVHTVLVDDAELPATDYDRDADGRLWRDVGWGYAGWGGRIEVNYTAGYLLPDNAPATLQMAVIDAIGDERAFGNVDPTIRAVAHLGVRVDFQTAAAARAGGANGLSASTIAAIKSYRRYPI